MCNIKSIAAFARLYCFLKIVETAAISRIKKCIFVAGIFDLLQNFSKRKDLEDFLKSFLEIVHLKGCLGGISRNSNF